MCAPGARVLTGAWTTTETVDGENASLWRGSLQVVQQGGVVVGRWEPPGGALERAVAGTFADGIVRAALRSVPAQPAADVDAAAARSWTLSLSSDGTLLTGRWIEDAVVGAGAPARQGTLVAAGEAGCAAPPAPPAAASSSAAADLLPCASWDVSGTWAVAPPPTEAPPWRLRLWQDGDTVLGWYEPATEPAAFPPAAGLPSWVVDGALRGRTLRLTHYLGDSATIARTLVLDPDGRSLAGAWPLPFGPAEREVLHGDARCAEPNRP